jgi:hypothetical protein
LTIPQSASLTGLAAARLAAKLTGGEKYGLWLLSLRLRLAAKPPPSQREACIAANPVDHGDRFIQAEQKVCKKSPHRLSGGEIF